MVICTNVQIQMPSNCTISSQTSTDDWKHVNYRAKKKAIVLEHCDSDKAMCDAAVEDGCNKGEWQVATANPTRCCNNCKLHKTICISQCGSSHIWSSKPGRLSISNAIALRSLSSLAICSHSFSERVKPHEWPSCGDEAEGWSPWSEGPPTARLLCSETAVKHRRFRPSFVPERLVASELGIWEGRGGIYSHVQFSHRNAVELHHDRGGIVYPRRDDSQGGGTPPTAIPGSIGLVRGEPPSQGCDGQCSASIDPVVVPAELCEDRVAQ